MEPTHEPSPEFTRFLEWQTRTELRRAARFRPERRAAPALARWAQMAALVTLSVVLGGGAVYAMERIEDSREVQYLLERNQLEIELAKRATDLAARSVATVTAQAEEGFVSQAEVERALLHVSELEYDIVQLQLVGDELRASGRPVDRRLSAPLAGARDFVSEDLRLERGRLAQRTSSQASAIARIQVQYESGLVTSIERDRAQQNLRRIETEIAHLDLRLALRADFLVGRIDADSCERRGRVIDLERRRSLLKIDLELSHGEFERAQLLEAEGFVLPSETAELRAAIERLDVGLQLIELELELELSK